MQRGEEEFVEAELPCQQLIDLQRRAIALMGNNNVQAKFLLKAIPGISNGAFIINCLQNQTNTQTPTFKLTKTQVNGILDLVKKYYQLSSSKIQPNKKMNKQCEAYRKMDQIVFNLRQSISREFDNITDFKKSYLENASLFEEMMADFLQSLRDTLIDAQQMKQYSKSSLPKLRQKLKRQIEDILKCFLSNDLSGQIEDVARKIIAKPAIDCQQFLYQIKNNFREGILNRIIIVIQNLDAYVALKQFDIEDINIVKIEFEIFFYDKFSKVIPFKILREILRELLNNPQYYFTSRADLSDQQKKELVDELWLKQDSMLLTLMKAYKYKDTLQFNINQDIQTILFHLIFTCKYNLADKIAEIKYNLVNYNLTSFFDQTEFVSNQVKSIYEFIGTNCKDYMKGYSNMQCATMQRIENLMKLKVWLNQKVSHIPYHHWAQIEEEIMNGNLNIIEILVSNEETASLLREWAHNNLSKYFEIILKKSTLKDRVKNEIVQFFVKKGWRGLSFMQIDTIANDLLENPYFEVIEASRILTQQNKNDLKIDFQKLPLLSQYSKFRKIDLESFEISAKIKVQQETNKLKSKIPYQIKQRVLEAYLKNPTDSTVYEQEDVSQKWKMQFLQTVKSIPEVTTYIQNYNVVKCIKKREAYLQKLRAIFRPYEFEIVKQYVCLSGEIVMNSEGKITNQNCSKELTDAFKSLTKPNLTQFRQAQSSMELKEFIDELPTIAQFFKEECQSRLIQISKKFFSDYQPQEEKQLAEKIKEILSVRGANNLLEDQVFEYSRNTDLKTAIAQESRYKRLVAVEKSTQTNQKMFAELKLRKKIKEMYDHQALMNISSSEKTSIIQKISVNFQFQEIKKYTKINDEQKDSLIMFIKKSQQYNGFNQVKGISSKKIQSTKLKQPMIEQKPEQKKPSEDKRNPEVKMQEKKPIQERFEQQVQPRQAPIQVLSQQQKKKLYEKWDGKLTQIRLYKNARDRDYKDNTSQLIENVLRGFPWNDEKSIQFWKSGPVKRFFTELTTFKEQNQEELRADCQKLFK